MAFAIPYVAAFDGAFIYPFGMKGWGSRFRAHMRLHKQSQESLGDALGVSQGAVGHWLSGRRQINLSEFWRLCEVAGADPRVILFHEDANPALADEIKKVLAAHPELHPGYQGFERSLRRSKNPRKRRVKAPV